MVVAGPDAADGLGAPDVMQVEELRLLLLLPSVPSGRCRGRRQHRRVRVEPRGGGRLCRCVYVVRRVM